MQVQLKTWATVPALAATENIGGVTLPLAYLDFGPEEAVSRERYEIQNEGDGIVVIKPLHRSRRFCPTQLVSAPKH